MDLPRVPSAGNLLPPKPSQGAASSPRLPMQVRHSDYNSHNMFRNLRPIEISPWHFGHLKSQRNHCNKYQNTTLLTRNNCTLPQRIEF